MQLKAVPFEITSSINAVSLGVSTMAFNFFHFKIEALQFRSNSQGYGGLNNNLYLHTRTAAFFIIGA